MYHDLPGIDGGCEAVEVEVPLTYGGAAVVGGAVGEETLIREDRLLDDPSTVHYKYLLVTHAAHT